MWAGPVVLGPPTLHARPGDVVWQYVVLPLLPIYWYLPLYQTLIVLSGLRRAV